MDLLLGGTLASTIDIVIIATFAAVLFLTPLVRLLARRAGVVAAPRGDRWHRQPTAMLGGIAIAIPVIAMTLATAPHRRDILVVVVASSLLFVIGLIDDFLHIRPYQKLIGQIVAAAFVVDCGLLLPWTHSATLNVVITLVWLIGIANAVNMLDNMDGLAAGVAAIAAAFLAANFSINHQTTEAIVLAGFAAALAGFLVYNYNPASIFMGDCGSLFVGFFLATASLLSGRGGGRSRSLLAVLAVPVLVLFVPIFDTTFVTLMRKLAGRAASRGGRDHTSHRLVALGLTERRAVWMMYALATAGGAMALLVRRVTLDVSLIAMAGFIIALTFLGIHLGGVRVYDESETAAAKEKALVSFLLDLSQRRRIFEVALDAALIVVAYYLAYAVRFGSFRSDSTDWQLFVTTLPLVVCIKEAAFLLLGVYRGIWRYVSLSDVFVLGRAVVLSEVATVIALVFAFRFAGFSRVAYGLDALLLVVLVTSSRFAFRMLRGVIPAAHQREGKRVLIYGAGDGGELLAREIANNSALNYAAVAFVDDDSSKRGRIIHGRRVHAAREPLADLCRRLRIEEVLISTTKIDGDRLSEIAADCAKAGIALTRACITFQPIRAGRETGAGESSAASAVAIRPPS